MHPDDASTQPREAAGLTIGDLAQQTGLSPAALRMWETRYGFPEPTRLASGHRRYNEADVDAVRQVLHRRNGGLRLEAAIEEAAAARPPGSPSIFAELRRRHPGLVVHRLRKATLIALSRAIEDQCCAAAAAPILFGAFQRGDFYAGSSARWQELARVAKAAVVFADRWDTVTAQSDGPVRVELPENAPLQREWAVVCDAGDASACLSAWELPGQSRTPDRERVFETIWTVDPVVVRDAARVAANVAVAAGVVAVRPLVDELAGQPAVRTLTPADMSAFFNRVVAYVDHLS